MLARLLTRSLSHTVVPALVHVVTHSTLTDYYCWYCFKQDVYCEYCQVTTLRARGCCWCASQRLTRWGSRAQYSPMQNYWAMYYAGYFSTWYGACRQLRALLDSP